MPYFRFEVNVYTEDDITAQDLKLDLALFAQEHDLEMEGSIIETDKRGKLMDVEYFSVE